MRTSTVIIGVLGLALGCGTVTPDRTARGTGASAAPSDSGTRVDGKRDGAWTVHRRGGGAEAKGAYRAGRRVGDWTWWHAGGKKHASGRYRDGARHGRWQVWAPDGTLISDEDFRSGRRVTSRLARPRGDWRKRRCPGKDLRWRLESALPALQRCYTTARAGGNSLRGQLVARFAVDSDGVVSDVAIRSNTTSPAPALDACVEGVVFDLLAAMPPRGRCLAEQSMILGKTQITLR